MCSIKDVVQYVNLLNWVTDLFAAGRFHIFKTYVETTDYQFFVWWCSADNFAYGLIRTRLICWSAWGKTMCDVITKQMCCCLCQCSGMGSNRGLDSREENISCFSWLSYILSISLTVAWLLEAHCHFMAVKKENLSSPSSNWIWQIARADFSSSEGEWGAHLMSLLLLQWSWWRWRHATSWSAEDFSS